MITEKELCRGIDECLAEPITGSKRSILADLIVIKSYLFGERELLEYPPTEQVEERITVNGDTDFLAAVNGKKPSDVWRIIDELVEAVKTLHPRMYDRVLEKLADL